MHLSQTRGGRMQGWHKALNLDRPNLCVLPEHNLRAPISKLKTRLDQKPLSRSIVYSLFRVTIGFERPREARWRYLHMCEVGQCEYITMIAVGEVACWRKSQCLVVGKLFNKPPSISALKTITLHTWTNYIAATILKTDELYSFCTVLPWEKEGGDV